MIQEIYPGGLIHKNLSVELWIGLFYRDSSAYNPQLLIESK